MEEQNTIELGNIKDEFDNLNKMIELYEKGLDLDIVQNTHLRAEFEISFIKECIKEYKDLRLNLDFNRECRRKLGDDVLKLQLKLEPNYKIEDTTVQFSKTGIEGNFWYSDAARLCKIVQENPSLWLFDMDLKYLNIGVDTRDGAFRVYARDGVEVTPDRILKAANKAYTNYGDKQKL